MPVRNLLGRTLTFPTLLVIDFDHTLIHAVEAEMAAQIPVLWRRFAAFNLEEYGYHVFVRPHVIAFLRFVFAYPMLFRVAFWTAGTRKYASMIYTGIMHLVNMPEAIVHALWDRSHTTVTKISLVKDLNHICESLAEPMSACLLLDDDARHALYPANAAARRLKVKPFHVFGAGAEKDLFFYYLHKDFRSQVKQHFDTQKRRRKARGRRSSISEVAVQLSKTWCM